MPVLSLPRLLTVLAAFAAALLLAFPAPLHARNNEAELQKIEALLARVKASKVTFLRNGSEYTATEAHDHLRRKLKSAQNSWFAPPKEEWTAKLFIEKIASRSSVSGRVYRVRLADGKVVETRVWLTQMLREIEPTLAEKSPSR